MNSRQIALAEKLMGPRFFGPSDWNKFFGAEFSESQLGQKSLELPCGNLISDILKVKCPFEKEKRIKETHFLFLGLNNLNGSPLTVMKFHDLYPQDGKKEEVIFKYSDKSWYFNSDIAKSVCSLSWYLAYLNIIPGSFNKGYNAQLRHITTNFSAYFIPSAIEEAMKLILYFEKNRIRLNKDVFARCSDKIDSSGNNSVLVGGFQASGFSINKCNSEYPFPMIGVAGFHKFFSKDRGSNG